MLDSTKNLLHLFPLCQPIYQLVKVSDLSGDRVVDLFNTIATDGAFDEMGIWVQGRSVEELFKRHLFFHQLLDFGVIKDGQPGDHLMELFFLSLFSLFV